MTYIPQGTTYSLFNFFFFSIFGYKGEADSLDTNVVHASRAYQRSKETVFTSMLANIYTIFQPHLISFHVVLHIIKFKTNTPNCFPYFYGGLTLILSLKQNVIFLHVHDHYPMHHMGKELGHRLTTTLTYSLISQS